MHRGTLNAGARGWSRRLAGAGAAVVVALAGASVAASWVDDQVLSKSDRSTLSPAARIGASFFELRFSAHELRRAAASDAQMKLAKLLFAQAPAYTYESTPRAVEDEPAQAEPDQGDVAQTAQATIPMPRPRPPDASALLRDIPANRDVALNDHPDDPTVLEKLSSMFKYRLTLASLTPTDGVFAPKPNLASLGYDGETAVYDISAHVVYLPDGSKLEAHSGLGDTRDDPTHVNEHQVGATPPAIYELKPREQLFHGVQALRMNPVEGSALGRTGLLVHSYMLGPNGDSNGCVSIRDYDRFLAAYQKGEFKRLAVVTSIAAATKQSSL
jgi:hypothetical protein